MSQKVRIDQLLFAKGLVESRERAKTTVMAGLVYQDEQRIDKPGQLVDENANIIVRGDPIGFVSRGGLKLAKALDEFAIDCNGLYAVDAGASTGGFTDCLLKRGAAHVWAIDVGYGQLAWKLREDSRVSLFERTNIRHFPAENIGRALDLAVADVSFISLKLVLPSLHSYLQNEGQAVCLVKPQFEAGREQVGKKGVVRDPAVHEMVLHSFCQDAKNSGFYVNNLSFSPIRGPEGNIEYLAHLLMNETNVGQYTISNIVEQAQLSV